jgi:hypothetical protein
MSAATRTFTQSEIRYAAVFAVSLEVGFFLLLVLAGSGDAWVREKKEAVSEPIPIAVKPVIDDLPLLKLGSKKLRAKLPDMWKKNPPIRRFEEKSAPSALAEKTPEAIPTSEVAKGDAEPPPPDAELAKKVDELLQPDATAPDQPHPPGEGSPDGVKEGTEKDPLKARAISLYLVKIQGWFSARFRPPSGEIPCEDLKKLSAGVAANVGPSRTVTGYSLRRPSGNPIFDAKVKSTMDAIIGQELPPPPPNYPDILGTTVLPSFSGQNAQCQ